MVDRLVHLRLRAKTHQLRWEQEAVDRTSDCSSVLSAFLHSVSLTRRILWRTLMKIILLAASWLIFLVVISNL